MRPGPGPTGLLAAALLLLVGAGGSKQRVEWGFNEGSAPLPLQDAPPASRCASCHTTQHAAWADSRHRASWTNDLMLVGYAAETLDFCVHCHAPRPQAKAEILANRAFYRSLDPRSEVPVGTAHRAPEPHAQDGVDCAACHWRDGVIVSAEVSYAAPHRVVADPALRDGSLCEGCHDFSMPETVDGQLIPGPTPMQSTTAEWRAWRKSGGQESCVDCHMPGGDHTLPGAHDRDRLTGAFHVSATRSGGTLTLEVASVGVGHHLPTGDLFRHATLEVDRGRGFETMATFGRSFSTTFDEDGLPHRALSADTSLRPGQPRSIVIPSAEPLPWRLVWHDAAPHDELRGLLDPDAITAIVARGVD